MQNPIRSNNESVRPWQYMLAAVVHASSNRWVFIRRPLRQFEPRCIGRWRGEDKISRGENGVPPARPEYFWTTLVIDAKILKIHSYNRRSLLGSDISPTNAVVHSQFWRRRPSLIRAVSMAVFVTNYLAYILNAAYIPMCLAKSPQYLMGQPVLKQFGWIHRETCRTPQRRTRFVGHLPLIYESLPKVDFWLFERFVVYITHVAHLP